MAFTVVTVTNDYDLADGTDPAGTVTFTPSVPMVNGPTVVAAPVVGRLNVDGVLTIALAANTDPATVPAGNYYRVDERIGGVTRTFNVQVPHDLGSTLNLYSLTQLASPPGLSFPAPGAVGALLIGNNLDDVASASTARTNLGLGGAAVLGVGTGAGSVAAGDDSRFTLPTPLSRFATAPVTVTYAASVTLDASLGDVFRVTATGDLTLADITGGVDGQIVRLEVLASGADRTVTVTGADTATVLSGQWWIGTFYFNAAASAWLEFPPPPAAASGLSFGSRLHTDWTRRPNGTPSAGDEGAPLLLVHTGTQDASVSSGKLVGNVPNSQNAAYVNQDLGSGSKVLRIGGTFGFGAGTTAGAATFAAWATQPPAGMTAAPDAHIHLAVTPTAWIYGVFQSGTLTTIATADFSTALPQDGTPLTAEVSVSGSTATITLPDRTTRTFTDSRIGSIAGRYACWEMYRDVAGDADAFFYSTWADAVTRPVGYISDTEVARTVTVQAPPPVVATWSAGSFTSVSPTTSSTDVNAALTVTQRAGPTGGILFDIDAHINWAVSGASKYYVWNLAVVGGGTYTFYEIVAGSSTFIGVARRLLPLTGLNPGQPYTVKLQHLCGAADAGNYLLSDGGSGRPVNMVATAF